MNNQELENTSIARYYHSIENKEIEVSYEIKETYKHIYHQLYNHDLFHFDIAKAEQAIDFIEKFCHLPKVRGNPLVKLMLWQRAMIETIFGFVDENRLRQYQEIFFVVGRKNAKSTLAAMIGLYLLVADGESEPELYTTATKKEQAKILWQAAVDMIHKSKELQQFCKCRVSDIACNLNGGIFRPLASDSNSLDGLNSTAIFLDEVHAYKDSQLYDVMVDSTAAREQPLTIITTTAGFLREGLFDLKINEYNQIIRGYADDNGYKDNRRIGFIYKLDNKKEWLDFTKWIKANPGLGEIRSLEKLSSDVDRAKSNPIKVKDLLAKFFNLPQTSQDAFLNFEDAKNDETFDPDSIKGKLCIGGFDLSQTTDLTSAVILVKQNDKYYILSKSWMPEDVFEKRLREDKVPYDIWVKNGYLDLCQGNKINYKDVYNWFVNTTKKYNLKMYKIGYDPYSAQYLVDDLKDYFGKDALDEIRQGTKTLSLPLQELRAEFQEHNIIYNNNPLFCWCLCNLQVKVDENGGYNTIKNRNGKVRDDAAMALLDAYTSYLRNKQVFDYYNK